jgi:hypothetical protein
MLFSTSVPDIKLHRGCVAGIIFASLAWGQFPVNSKGWIVTGLPAAQDNLLGPLIPSGKSPWIFGDLAERNIADNMAPAALAETPTLGPPCPGTASLTSGNNFLTTTADMTACLAGKQWVVFAWNSIDGAGTGRAQCPISSVTSTQINCSENMFEPSFSGITAYTMPPPDAHNCDFQCWIVENPTVSWNYYDVAIGLYRIYYRTGIPIYQTQARAYADIQWQWVIDHGYRFVSPRAGSMISQFFRALDGHSERIPGLYNWVSVIQNSWANPVNSPNIDNRESGYALWDIALGAKIDTDPTRHTQYCSWLSTYQTTWNSVQVPDGSFGENEYSLNTSYVSAPKTFVAPFRYQTSGWRVFANAKAFEASYESLNDTTAQGCNNTTLAAATLTTITNLVTWQNNYSRDTSNRGAFYENNSQSADQGSVFPGGTVSVNLTSTSVTGSGTNWNTAGYCDGTHFIGIQTPQTVYKIASCADNTHLTLSVAFGLYGEMSNVSGSGYGIAPAASTGCHSSATYCFGATGDRNLTRPICGELGWLYAMTLNPTYKGWTDECISATLGGPTAGLTSAATIGVATLPCSGPACDGLVNDTIAAAPNCGDTGGVAPCANQTFLYGNLGKNFGEAFGAPGIDNALAWSLAATGGTSMGGKITFGGSVTQQ